VNEENQLQMIAVGGLQVLLEQAKNTNGILYKRGVGAWVVVCGGRVVGVWWACGGRVVGVWWACGGRVVGVWWACGEVDKKNLHLRNSPSSNTYATL
jgi:hypothetical protein